ncbi:non-ribosomal peptide synthetase, partial [Coniella lustricola]
TLSVLNPNPQRMPGPALLHRLIKDDAPHDIPAIDYRDADGTRHSVTYAELHRQADRLALSILKVLPNDRQDGQLIVPLLLPQCPELYISQLAILKAGGAFCPLNLDAPPERIRFIFGDVAARVVITSRSLQSKINALESDVALVVVDDQDEPFQDDLEQQEHTTTIQETKPGNLAYVMYTSGSTGTPKGVGISHDAATQALLAHDRYIPHFSRFLQFAAPTFDVSVFEIFFPLLRGATLVSCHRATMLNDLPAALRDLKVDACELTPTVAGSLLRSRENTPSLRLLLTIGEMLTEPVVREFGGDENKTSMLWAMYGPTEATIHCTLQPACHSSSSPNNVGFPLDTVSAFVLQPLQDDDEDKDAASPSSQFAVLPMGEMGELAVGGFQTAIGYINRPEQTSKVFIDTPYGRLYRTGDKARFKKDGTIECFGRISDGQIKLRGQRIELGEIEQAVLRTSGCHGAVAAVIRGVIVVFCDTDAQNEKTQDKILQVCGDWLPSYMVPGDVVLINAFPRLPSGKVDRKQLKVDYEESQSNEVESSGDGFRDNVERQLSRLVQDVLGIKLLSSSTLSGAGIDSLASIKLASHLRSSGFAVSAIDILNSRTLASLRSIVQQEQSVSENLSSQLPSEEDAERIASVASTLGVQVDTIETVTACTPTQLSMLSETLHNTQAYFNWIELQLPANYSLEAITAWFEELARCNEALRTGFVAFEGVFRQIIWRKLITGSVRGVRALSRQSRLDEAGFKNPFAVQILVSESTQPTTVLLQIHHALYDGWSFDILLADLNLLASGGTVNSRPPFRLVSDYYNSTDFSRHADHAREYWAEHLLGYQPSPMPQLLSEHSQTAQSLSVQHTLDLKASEVHNVTSLLDISPQVLFQACLLWLWGSIQGSDDVVIGNVTSGRTIPVNGVEDVVGPCLTSIPLRAKLGQVCTIKELLQSIHATNRESLTHCTLPLVDIKKAAGITPGQTLYDALFVYQESIPSRLSHKDSDQVRKVAHEDYLETKLLVEVEPKDGRFQLRAIYHADVFHPDHVQQLVQQFECSLMNMVGGLNLEIGSISSSFPDQLLSIYNANPKSLEGCCDIASLFEKTVAQHPKREAICFAKSVEDGAADLELINYGELNDLANKIARHLKTLGVEEGQNIAIIMEKSIMLYAGILAILKTGCAYLPLLPSTPRARIHTILTQAQVFLCISDDISADHLPEPVACRFVGLRTANYQHHSCENIGTTVDPSRVANIIYTSGSTGVPKGVCVTQLNICSNLDVLSRIYPVKHDSRMLQVCSQAFDVSVFEILFSLTRGMCLCSGTNDTLFSDLERSINAMKVTHLSMTTTVASLVDPVNVPQVEFLVTSGEPMTVEVAKKWVGKLYQGYGPSETTNICSAKKMTSRDQIRHLGHTFENTSAAVLAPNSMDVLPIGCVGEFCFGGDQVVAGYLNLPAVTQEKFILHPKLGRIYRSGDIGRMLADGSLLIVGRVDDQIKLRGQRIELGEVNNVVAVSSVVSNCVTLLVNVGDDSSSQQLACFYVLKSAHENGASLLQNATERSTKDKEAIFQHLRSRLPGYMVPSYLIPISSIPLTSSGKVDKAKLSAVFGSLGSKDLEALSSSAHSMEEAAGDWSEEECKVAAVLATALKVPIQEIGRWTPLTSLGLDSISAISVAKQLQESFVQRRLPISVILQGTSVARLAALLQDGQPQQKSDTLESGNQRLEVFSADFVENVRGQIAQKGGEIEAVLPCTPLQEAMLASSAGSSSYLNKMLLRLNGDLAASSTTAMKEHWSVMFRRHGILRTCFFTTNDREYAVAQCVLKKWEPKWVDLTAAHGSLSLDEAINKHVEAVPAAIDSGKPPVSLALIQDASSGDTGRSQYYLSFICHHAMYDGVAISQLLKEVEMVASGVQFAEPAPSYEPFLREMLNLPADTDDFWMKHLRDVNIRSLPRLSSLSKTETTAPSDGRDSLVRALDISLSGLEASLKTLNVSMLSLLQASWGTLLRLVSQSEDVCFGNVVSGRSAAVDRVEELVAPCFNTIPTRINFDRQRRNKDLLRFFQLLNPQLLQYQFAPLRRIQAVTAKKSNMNGSPSARLFDTLLLLQQSPRALDETMWTLERDDGEMDFPLVCEVTPWSERDEVEVKLHFDRSYISDDYATFVYDTLCFIVSSFSRYSSSHVLTRNSLPAALQQRLDALNLVYERTEQNVDVVSSSQFSFNDDWSESERIVRSVLSKISNTPEDNITRNMVFFKLGLDSINAIQIAAMLRKQGFATITAADVLEGPTCTKLAEKLVQLSSSVEAEVPLYDLTSFQQDARTLIQDSGGISWDSVEQILPCTPLQMGLLAEFVASEGDAYLNFLSFEFEAGFTASQVRDAWVQVTERFEMLRTGFVPLDHEDATYAMLQYKFGETTLPVHIQDEGFDLPTWRSEAGRAVFGNLRQPPWQVALIHKAASMSLEMHLSIHHVLYDAHSLQVIVSALGQALIGETISADDNNNNNNNSSSSSSSSSISAAVRDIITHTKQCARTAQNFWETQAANAVVNKFPVMTLLREDEREIQVKSKISILSQSSLEQAVKKTGFTIQAVAQAAWLRILSSYLGEPAVVFGTIFSGRDPESTRNTAFPCIMTLPVVGQNVSSNRELVEAMMAYNVKLQRHQWTPLTHVQRWLGHPNTKLFDTLLVYQKFEHDAHGTNSDECRPWRVIDEKASIDYPVSLEIEPQRDGAVELRLTFFTDILPREQAELLLAQFDAVFSDLLQFPGRQEDDLFKTRQDLFAILPAAEPELKTQITFLHEFVEISAQAQPEKTALQFVSAFQNDKPLSREWTYKALNENGNKVANMLAPHITTGDIVAVCFDKCPEAHFAMLGILKAGCALLALDPGAPSARKEFILQDSGAAVLLIDKARSLDLGFDVSVPVLRVDEDALLLANSATPTLTRELTPQDRSYCLYTSGTTGTPKGCEITHENAVQAMLAFQVLFEGHWQPTSKWLQFASYHFDVSVLEQYWTWSVGIALVAAPRDVILEDLAGTISRLEVTHIDLTPSLARLIHPDEVPSLCRGVFITGGEELKQEILDTWGPKRVIHNFYGPTEATIGVTTFSCVPENGRPSNIGKQFPNVGSFVLKPGTDIPVLKGGVGELCVSGKLVGKGYLNRSQLTNERFPTLATFGERVYRTGDLVRVLHDGCFDFLGRADDQVKLRGQRLEIGEINHCIKTGVEEVTDVVTLVIRNKKQQKDLLVSFVITTQHPQSQEQALDVLGGEDAARIGAQVQRACREKLPGYMVPTYVLLLPFIPLSPNNKAEFKELRALFNKLSPEQLVAPSTASNSGLLDAFGHKVCMALSGMTGIPEREISSTTSIFELGVDSITAIRLATALKREGLKHATPAIILRNPTVGDLAQALKAAQKQQLHRAYSTNDIIEAKQAVEACHHRHRGAICRTLRVTPQEIEYIAPCSALQQGMISRSRTEDKTGAYFNTFRFDLVESVELARLRSAWEQLVARNAVLRTRFVSTTEGFVQVALKEAGAPWMEIQVELKNGDESGGDGNLDEVLERHRKSWVEANGWNIDAPLEFLAVSHGERRLLVVHIFHAIYDANSFELMLDEVVDSYNDQDAANAPGFLEALLHGPLKNHSSSKEFWVEHLRDVSFGPTPRISETPSQECLGVSRQVHFSDLDKIRVKLGVTHQALVQALWSVTLQEHINSSVTFGIIVSGRSLDMENVDKAIGPLFNTVPYHHRYSKRQTWAAAVRQCHEFNTAILPFQHVPLRDVQKWCSGGQPLFDSLFSFQRRPSATGSADRDGLWRQVESSVNADYPLALEVTLLADDVLQALAVTSSGFSDMATLSKLLDTFEKNAKAMVEDVDSLVLPNAAHLAHVEAFNGWKGGSDVVSEPIGDEADFEWTSQATAIRNEMALLAGIEASALTPKTSLLELGLDSIDTIKLSARLRRVDITLTNSELIKGQSIAEFVVILRNKEAAEGEAADSGYSSEAEDPSTPLKRYFEDSGFNLENVQDILPPTPLQDSMVSEMIQSDFRRYFNHDVLELSPGTDVSRLKSAWQTVIKNSPILRTVFVEVETSAFAFTFAQLVLRDLSFNIHEVDIASLDDTAELMELARTRAFAGRGSADLIQLTFARFREKICVVFSIAHALYDGWSLGLLHRDVEAAYNGTYAPRQEYTGYLGEIIRSGKHEAQDFWSDYVSGAAPSIFPSRNEALAEAKVNKAENAMTISATTLKTFCKRHAISQQAVAQVCWAAVLATHCQQLDVTFGVVLSGRDSEASEAMLFPTMNTVPVRAVFHGSAAAFLRYMQENMTNINQFQHFPLRKIQAMLPNRQQGSLFNTLFILQKRGIADVEGGEPFVKSVSGSSAVEYPVCVEMEIQGEGIVWRTACDDAFLTTDGTQKLLEELDSVLTFLVNGSESDMLQVGEDGVSICGLPPFRPQQEEPDKAQKEEDVVEEGGEEYEWSTREATIRSVLAEVSATAEESIKKNHSIYHLGLDSISAIKVSTLLRKKGISVTVREMIQAASIKQIAAKASLAKQTAPSALDGVMTTATTSDGISVAINKILEGIQIKEHLRTAGIVPSDVEELLPATAMQAHMLSVWQNTNGSVFFTEFRYRLSGVSSGQVIDDAWRALARHHAILRTVFVATGSHTTPFVQAVLRSAAEMESPFWALDVQADGDSDGHKWIVRLRLHHALYDGVSLPLLIGDFKRLLSNAGQGMASHNDDFSVWKSLIAASAYPQAVQKRRCFWEEYLRGLCSSPLSLQDTTVNTDTPTKDPEAAAAAVERVVLLRRAALANTSNLKALCAQHGVSIQALFLAAYAKTLAFSSSCLHQTDTQGVHDVIFGVYLANRAAEIGDRENGALLPLPFPRLCLVPLRVRIASPSTSIVELAAEIQRDLHRISEPENVAVGLWEVQAWTGVVVDSFVNFLSLPDEVEDDNHEVRDKTLPTATSGRAVDIGTVSIVSGLTPLRWLEANVVKDAYPDAVDVEAALQPDGAMDIGVFGSHGKLGDNGAATLIDLITEVLH